MRTFLILLVSVASASAYCELSLGDPFPIVAKRIGSKTAIVKESLRMRLSVNETVHLYCPYGMQIVLERIGNVIYSQTTQLTCFENGINLDEELINGLIYCNTANRETIFESNTSLPGCNGEATSLIIGYKLSGLSDVKLLAMCYDLSSSRLRFVNFLAYPPQNRLLDLSHTDHTLNQLHLDKFIGSLSDKFDYISDLKFTELITQQQQLGELFDPTLFDYSSLLQLKDFVDYNYLLNIVWFRALRQGNWKNWLDALRDNDDKFELRIGVSGVATLPLAHRCNASRTLKLEDNERIALSVPAYIWAHVRSLQPAGNAADEFVLVAHNSPYLNVLELSTFCDDICAEIPWLNKSLFGELHLLPMYGVVHCCRMDQIDKLTDFPFVNHQEQEQQQHFLSAAADAEAAAYSAETITAATPTELPLFNNF